MTEPQLFVDEADRFINGGALLDANLDVGKSKELQYLIFLPPYAAKLILRPATGRRGDDLPIAGAFAGPASRFEILLEDLYRRAVVTLVAVRLVGQGLAPLAALDAFDVFDAFDTVGSVTAACLPSKAAMRLASASFSSRAAMAIALIASNSSRLTKSIPPTHSRIFSRIEDSASRPTPAMVPATPFIILTRSSKIRFCDCITTSLQ
jgi:hypothetical protein